MERCVNFKLKIRKVDGYWNYDKSEFEGVSQIKESDEDIKNIWSKQYPLLPFVDPNFKTYDELKEKLNRGNYKTTKHSKP